MKILLGIQIQVSSRYSSGMNNTIQVIQICCLIPDESEGSRVRAGVGSTREGDEKQVVVSVGNTDSTRVVGNWAVANEN